MQSLPSFSYGLVKQGSGNPITFQLADTDDNFRTFLHKYSLKRAILRYWSFQVEEWFITDSSLDDFNTYNLCLTFPDSHTFAGLIQNCSLPEDFGKNTIILSSSGVHKSVDKGTPFIKGTNTGSEFVFTSNASGDWFSDKVSLTVRDQYGKIVEDSVKFKYKLKYKEYVSF